jgi:hypothetical protein
MVTATDVVSQPPMLAGSLGVSQCPDLASVALEISRALGAPILEERSQLFKPGGSLLAIYREQGPAHYGLLPALSGAAFLDVTGVSESSLMRLTVPLTQSDPQEGDFGYSRLGCGLVVSDPAIRRDHYGQTAACQICLDERKWAQALFLQYKDSCSLEHKAARPAGWIFSVAQEGLVWSVESSNYRASIARRWFGGCKG